MNQLYTRDTKFWTPPDPKLIRPKLTQTPNGDIRVEGFLTPAESAQLDRVANGKFFLFRNDGGWFGERGICHRVLPDGTEWGCFKKHMYFSYMCVERPYRGLEDGLWAVFRAASDSGKKGSIMKAISHLPDLATHHPQTARILQPDDDGENWWAALLALPEAITPARARELARKINSGGTTGANKPPIPFRL